MHQVLLGFWFCLLQGVSSSSKASFYKREICWILNSLVHWVCFFLFALNYWPSKYGWYVKQRDIKICLQCLSNVPFFNLWPIVINVQMYMSLVFRWVLKDYGIRRGGSWRDSTRQLFLRASPWSSQVTSLLWHFTCHNQALQWSRSAIEKGAGIMQ